MKVKNFFKEFVLIENHLFSLAGNIDKLQGFLNLLKYLQSKNLLSTDVLVDINFIWQTRNKIVSSPSGEQEISDEVSDLLVRLKQKLDIGVLY